MTEIIGGRSSSASSQVRAKLRGFLTEQGHHPVAGLNTFIDRVGFGALAATAAAAPHAKSPWK